MAGLDRNGGRACPRRVWLWMAGLFLAGLALRLPLLGSPGTTDLDTWKTWSYGTTRAGLAGVYSLQSKREPPLTIKVVRQALAGELDTRPLKYNGWARYVDYPPGIFYFLWPVATAYKTFVSPGYVDSPLLSAAIKLPVLLCELVTALLLFRVARKLGGSRTGLVAAGSYWLNPTVILAGSALAYLDALYGLALVAGGIALLRDRHAGLWTGWAAALAIKLQPLLMLPAMLAISVRRGLPRLLGYMVISGLVLVVVALPFVLSGHLLAMLAGSAGSSHQPYVSAFQFNLWWLWSYLYKVAHDTGAWGVTTDFLWEYDVEHAGFGSLYAWGLVLFGLFTLFLVVSWLWRHRRDAPGAAVGIEGVVLLALQLYGGTMLLTRIHENHLFGVIPLLALAAGHAMATQSNKARVLWFLYSAVSLVVGVNLLIFYGLGNGIPNPLPRTWFGLDGSVVFTALNILLFCLCCVLWARGFFDSRSLSSTPVQTMRSRSLPPQEAAKS
jgi:hypothetical protein